MTEQKKKLLKAKIAAALYHESGKVPTQEEREMDQVCPGALHGRLRTAFWAHPAEEKRPVGNFLVHFAISRY